MNTRRERNSNLGHRQIPKQENEWNFELLNDVEAISSSRTLRPIHPLMAPVLAAREKEETEQILNKHAVLDSSCMWGSVKSPFVHSSSSSHRPSTSFHRWKCHRCQSHYPSDPTFSPACAYSNSTMSTLNTRILPYQRDIRRPSCSVHLAERVSWDAYRPFLLFLRYYEVLVRSVWNEAVSWSQSSRHR